MKNDKIKEILEYIGKAKLDEYSKTHIWAINEKDDVEHLADVRGWGAIQHMFLTRKRAEEFQDSLGQFIVDAINEKIENHLSESKEEKCDGCKRAENAKDEYIYTCNCDVKEEKPTAKSVELDNDDISLWARRLKDSKTQERAEELLKELLQQHKESEAIKFPSEESIKEFTDKNYLSWQSGVTNGIEWAISEIKRLNGLKE